MKRHLNLLMTIIVLAGVLTVTGNAQTASAQKLIAKIPFTFNVGNKTLPAGKYTIVVVNPTSDRRILQIRSADGRSSAMIVTTDVIGKASHNTKLVFERYGDRYYFAQAQMAGDQTSLAAVKTSAERAEKRWVATTKQKTVVVIIAE